MSRDARIRDLRAELAELRDPGPQDKEGHALFVTVKGSLIADLAELGAMPEPSPVPQALTLRQIAATTMHRPTHPLKGTMTAHADPEIPMPKKTPQACLTTKLARLGRLQAEGRQIEVNKLTSDIRTYCKVNQLPVPSEAEKRRSGPKNPSQKGRLERKHRQGLPVPDESPHSGIATSPNPPRLVGPRAILAQREAMAALPKSGEHQLSLIPSVADRFRALRTQAVDLLPLCDGLEPEEAAAVRHQIDLLAEVLATGNRLAGEVA